MNSVPSDYVRNSIVVEDVHVPFKTTCIIEDISINSDTPIVNDGHASYESY